MKTGGVPSTYSEHECSYFNQPGCDENICKLEKTLDVKKYLTGKYPDETINVRQREEVLPPELLAGIGLEKEVWWRREFAIAVAAILGEQKLAYMLFFSDFISYYIVCPECENCDEELKVDYFELPERMKKGKAPSRKWDGSRRRRRGIRANGRWREWKYQNGFA